MSAKKPTTAKQSFYFQPLVRKASAKRVVLNRVKKEILVRAGKAAIKVIRQEIRRSSWKKPPTKLIRSFSYKVGANIVTIESNHPAMKFLEEGVHTHTMEYLKNKTVPIITDTGKLIFRKATAKAMEDGKWVHPGYQGRHFIRRGMKKAHREVTKIIGDWISEEAFKSLEMVTK